MLGGVAREVRRSGDSSGTDGKGQDRSCPQTPQKKNKIKKSEPGRGASLWGLPLHFPFPVPPHIPGRLLALETWQVCISR